MVFMEAPPFSYCCRSTSDPDPLDDKGSINTMVDQFPIPPEVAELMHREELLRRAGEELLEEAQMLRAKYEGIIRQLRSLKEQTTARPDQSNGLQGK